MPKIAYSTSSFKQEILTKIEGVIEDE